MHFGSLRAIDNINFTVHQGEIFGCIGPNGAGKTTLINILTGQLEQTSGEVEVLGINTRDNGIKIRQVTGIVPEVESIPSFLTAKEYLYFTGRLHYVKNIERKVNYWLNFFKLEESCDILCKDLSKGMIQKLMLAGAFIHEPKILFLDEPFIGLDPIYQYKVQRYLDRYITRGGTIFICTHILELAEKICTRVAIINKGRIVAIGKLSEMRRRDDENLTEVFMRIVENHMNLNFFSPAT